MNDITYEELKEEMRKVCISEGYYGDFTSTYGFGDSDIHNGAHRTGVALEARRRILKRRKEERLANQEKEAAALADEAINEAVKE
jgi:hypothetical protein